MTAAFDQANAALKAAVRARMESTPADDPKLVGYVSQPATEPRHIDASTEDLQHVDWTGHDEDALIETLTRQRLRGDGLTQTDVHPTSQAYFELLDRMKALHASKSRDYGSEHDPLANIRNGAEFVGIAPWKGAMVRLSDKVTRLATFNRTGTLAHEGVEDTLLDLASYSLLALLLYREEHNGVH
jgi:hypothetical protein